MELVAPSVAKSPSWTVLPDWSVTVSLALMELNAPISMFALMSRMGTLIVPPVRVIGVVRFKVPAVAERMRLVPSVCVPASSVSRMLAVTVGAVAKLIVPAVQLTPAPVATFTVVRFSRAASDVYLGVGAEVGCAVEVHGCAGADVQRGGCGW